jgi:hypothetical protein
MSLLFFFPSSSRRAAAVPFCGLSFAEFRRIFLCPLSALSISGFVFASHDPKTL